MSEFRSKGLVIGDVHLASTPPGRRTSTYADDIFAKLEQTVEIAKNTEVDFVLFLGDIFHNPRPDRVPYSLTKRVCTLLASYQVPVVIVPGNHDIQAGDIDSAFLRQPIAMLEEVPNVTLLKWDAFEVVDGFVIHPIPGVPLVPVDTYAVECDESKFNLIAAHQTIARDGQGSMIFSHVGAEEVSEATKADFVAYGHLHSFFGFYEIDGVTFANLGSICRGTIDESDLKKEPQVYTLSVTGKDFDFEIHKLKYRPSEDVYRLEQYFQEKDRQKDISEYVKSIQSVTLREFSLDTIVSSIESRNDVEEKVREVAVECIREVSK